MQLEGGQEVRKLEGAGHAGLDVRSRKHPCDAGARSSSAASRRNARAGLRSGLLQEAPLWFNTLTERPVLEVANATAARRGKAAIAPPAAILVGSRSCAPTHSRMEANTLAAASGRPLAPEVAIGNRSVGKSFSLCPGHAQFQAIRDDRLAAPLVILVIRQFPRGRRH